MAIDYEVDKAVRLEFRKLHDPDGSLNISKKAKEITLKCGCKVKKYVHEDGAYIVEQDWCRYHAEEEGLNELST